MLLRIWNSIMIKKKYEYWADDIIETKRNILGMKNRTAVFEAIKPQREKQVL